jgi:hypothetical protein
MDGGVGRSRKLRYRLTEGKTGRVCREGEAERQDLLDSIRINDSKKRSDSKR